MNRRADYGLLTMPQTRERLPTPFLPRRLIIRYILFSLAWIIVIVISMNYYRIVWPHLYWTEGYWDTKSEFVFHGADCSVVVWQSGNSASGRLYWANSICDGQWSGRTGLIGEAEWIDFSPPFYCVELNTGGVYAVVYEDNAGDLIVAYMASVNTSDPVYPIDKITDVASTTHQNNWRIWEDWSEDLSQQLGREIRFASTVPDEGWTPF